MLETGLPLTSVQLEVGEQRADDLRCDRSQADGKSNVEHNVTDVVIHPDDPFPDRARHASPVRSDARQHDNPLGDDGCDGAATLQTHKVFHSLPIAASDAPDFKQPEF